MKLFSTTPAARRSGFGPPLPFTATHRAGAALGLVIAAGLLFLRLPGAESAKGVVRIDCEAGIAVSLDGRAAGVTSYAKGGLSLEKLPPGPHRITLTKPGFKPEEHTVVIRPQRTEILAVFYLQPDTAVVAKSPPPSDDPLKLLTEAERVVTFARRHLETTFATSPTPSRSLDGVRTNYEELRQSYGAASAALDAALREQAEAEAVVAARFRTDYAAFHALRADRATTSEQKHAAWGRLLAQWRLPPDLGPSALVWRQHRVAAARGNIRVQLDGEWPATLAAPKRILDGRVLPAEPADPRDPAFWELRDLTAAPHTLRLEHPDLEPTEGTLLVADAKTVVLTWTPRFKSARASP